MSAASSSHFYAEERIPDSIQRLLEFTSNDNDLATHNKYQTTEPPPENPQLDSYARMNSFVHIRRHALCFSKENNNLSRSEQNWQAAEIALNEYEKRKQEQEGNSSSSSSSSSSSFKKKFENLDNLKFDIFQFNNNNDDGNNNNNNNTEDNEKKSSSQQPFDDLVFVAFEIFSSYSFIYTGEYGISQHCLMSFLLTVRANYFDYVPFHNFRHAVNVLQTLHSFFSYSSSTSSSQESSSSSIEKKVKFSNEEIFCALVAAICHDLQHPGLNNQFLSLVNDPLAIRYNDQAILEQHHCSCCFALVEEAAGVRPYSKTALETMFSFWKNSDTPIQDFYKIRKLITSLIMSTEVVTHHSFVEKILKLSEEQESQENEKEEKEEKCNIFSQEQNKTTLLCGMLEAADISNEIRDYYKFSQKWSSLVAMEFLNQGDRMKKLEPMHKDVVVQRAKMFDREKMLLSEEQPGFISFLCLPLYRALSKVEPQQQQEEKTSGIFAQCVKQLEINKEKWTSEKDGVALTKTLMREAANNVVVRRRERIAKT